MSIGKQFQSANQALTFLLAGGATLTLVSHKTGARFTYKVVQPKEGSPHFVSLLTGTDNEGDYQYLGAIFEGRVFRHTFKSRISPEAPSHRAFAWTFSHLLAGRIPDQVEIWHQGKCGCCGRKLTVPESIASGIGPYCARKAA